MNLTHLTDQELMRDTKVLVKQESCLLVKILHHIREIDRRRLYSDFKKGLLGLVIEELGYPRDQALRRIKAMRMMRGNPTVEAKLENGELNLTTICIVQALFSQEKRGGKPLSRAEKESVIEKVSGKSTREVQKIVFSLSSTPLKLNEKIKMIAHDLYELTAAIDEETTVILEKLKGLLAHSHPGISNGALIKILGQIGLKELERVKSVAAPRPNSKAEVQRRVWKRDEARCTNCSSTYAVQEDHRIPKAKGGAYTLSNMRLLCRSCNQRAAIREFGIRKMERFLSAPTELAAKKPPYEGCKH